MKFADLESGVDNTYLMGPHQPLKIRNDFSSKVFGIVACMLGVTTALTFTATYLAEKAVIPKTELTGYSHIETGRGQYIAAHYGWPIYASSAVLYFVFLICMYCTNLTKSTGGGYFLLGLCNAAYSGIMVAMGVFLGSLGQADVVYQSFVGCFLIVGVLALVSRSFDVTVKGGYLFATLLALSFVGIFQLVLTLIHPGGFNTFHFVVGVIWALVLSFTILYNMQMILGEGKYAYSIDDYALASIGLYSSIVTLILRLMELIMRARR